MKKKYLMILLLATMFSLVGVSQNVTFASSGFERGVKMHLGLDSTTVVTQSQIDTITAIDLSGLDIKDIRDVVYLPNVQWLNLAHNEITDVSPVVSLDSLHYLDLRANKLENIDMLTYSSSDSMVVNVAYNYIMDFGRMLLPSRCRFSFMGRGSQINLSTPYLSIYQFYAAFDDSNKQCVDFHVLTNQFSVMLMMNGKSKDIAVDVGMQSCQVPWHITSTSKIYLTDGTFSDSTWIVPATRFRTAGGESINIVTGLPEDYTIAFLDARHGEVMSSEQQIVTYTTPTVAVPDTIQFSYYEGNKLRGIARYYVNCSLTGDINGDGIVDVTDVSIIIDIVLGKQSNETYEGRADLNGDGQVDVSDVSDLIDIVLGK